MRRRAVAGEAVTYDPAGDRSSCSKAALPSIRACGPCWTSPFLSPGRRICSGSGLRPFIAGRVSTQPAIDALWRERAADEWPAVDVQRGSADLVIIVGSKPSMIVSCAPFRVSFAGGGSDIASFYRKRRGAVLSCAIAKYSFIVVHPFFNASKYHLKYARTELVDRVDEIQHPILREALRMQSIDPGIEIVSIADIPGGTGLGSSSSFSVALLNALYAHRRIFVPKETLAQEACMLEIERLGEPIGKQDQYAAAYGGMNLIEFERHGGVTVQPLLLPTGDAVGARRQSHAVLHRQPARRPRRAVASGRGDRERCGGRSRMQQMVDLAYEMRDLLLAGDLDAFGLALHRGWEMKRGISAQISTSAIDDLYAQAPAAGALGGKLAGAGGGGFLLLYCPKPAQARVREALARCKASNFGSIGEARASRSRNELGMQLRYFSLRKFANISRFSSANHIREMPRASKDANATLVDCVG